MKEKKEPIFISEEKARKLRSDIDVLSLPRLIKAENKETYDLLMRRFAEVHVGTSGNVKELIISA